MIFALQKAFLEHVGHHRVGRLQFHLLGGIFMFPFILKSLECGEVSATSRVGIVNLVLDGIDVPK